MKRYQKRIIQLLALLLSVGLLFLAAYLKRVAEYKRAVRETSFSGIDLSSVPDGVYVGDYDVDLLYARVEVTVEDGKITEIHILEHRQERGKSAEAIADSIIREQKTDVDAVSGATNSSIVIRKAVENALRGEGGGS